MLYAPQSYVEAKEDPLSHKHSRIINTSKCSIQRELSTGAFCKRSFWAEEMAPQLSCLLPSLKTKYSP